MHGNIHRQEFCTGQNFFHFLIFDAPINGMWVPVISRRKQKTASTGFFLICEGKI